MEKEHWNAIVSTDPENKETAENKLIDLQKNPEYLRENALEKTPLESELIKSALAGVKKIAAKYGGLDKELSEDNIAVMSTDDMMKYTEDSHVIGTYNYYYNRAVVRRTDSLLQFTHYVGHELLHFHSFRSFRFREPTDVAVHRSGLSVFENFKDRPTKDNAAEVKDGEQYFDELDEAIVALLTRRFMEEQVERNSLLAEEVQAVREIKEWILKSYPVVFPGIDLGKMEKEFEEIIAFHQWELFSSVIKNTTPQEAGSRSDIFFKLGVMSGRLGLSEDESLNFTKYAIYSEYLDYRNKFNELLDKIVDASPESLTKGEVLEMFYKAFFTGKLLPLARLIESSLGKGAFREIGERFKKK